MLFGNYEHYENYEYYEYYSETTNDMSRMFIETKFLAQEAVLKVSLFRFLSSFCLYLWDAHNLNNIFEVHGFSYFYGVGKNPCHMLILK